MVGGRHCPVCGNLCSGKIKNISMKVSDGCLLPESYDVVACEECGMVYADTAASMSDYDHYYSCCNFYGDDSKEDAYMQYEMLEVFLEKYVGKDAELLELGAGNGHFEMALKEHGYMHITGTDPSEESVRRLRKNGIMARVASVYDEIPVKEKEKYDCIFLLEVAEHLLFPRTGIENIEKMLKAEGIFMVSVPDYSHIDSKGVAQHYFNLEHINYFSDISLDYMMSLHGMKRIDQKYGVDDMNLIQVYRKVGQMEVAVRDIVTEPAVRKFFCQQGERDKCIKEIISRLKREDRELVIWGTGSFVMGLFATTNLSECRISCFVDNNSLKYGRTMYGYPIYSPEYLKDKQTIVVICSMLNGRQIREQLEGMRTKNEIIVL